MDIGVGVVERLVVENLSLGQERRQEMDQARNAAPQSMSWSRLGRYLVVGLGMDLFSAIHQYLSSFEIRRYQRDGKIEIKCRTRYWVS